MHVPVDTHIQTHTHTHTQSPEKWLGLQRQILILSGYSDPKVGRLAPEPVWRWPFWLLALLLLSLAQQEPHWEARYGPLCSS